MSEAVEPLPGNGDAAPELGGGWVETSIAAALCAVAMLGPIIYIQYKYEAFISTEGDIKEGAAGATLALAVVMRTVSRTVLRTMVRTSARAGLKASMRGALRAGARAATRGFFASAFRGGFGKLLTDGNKPKPTDPAGIRKANYKSLLFGSSLLYASWVIVIGMGQPFSSLLSAEGAAAVEEEEGRVRAETLQSDERVPPEVEAWHAQLVVAEKKELFTEARRAYKGARGVDARDRAQADLILAQGTLTEAQGDFSELLVASNGRVAAPEEPEEELSPTAVDDLADYLYTYAPYPGQTDWSSPVIWAGGVVWVLPLWFVFFVQGIAARRKGLILRHETGVDGGFIQLYFAGAFSFMPLTSDVIIEGTQEDKGQISVVGLMVPTMLSLLLWAVWKVTGGVHMPILLAADAFLIYPMVQTFPLNPLDGVQVWRWSRWRWFVVFGFVMSVFMFVGSEGLKNVI